MCYNIEFLILLFSIVIKVVGLPRLCFDNKLLDGELEKSVCI